MPGSWSRMGSILAKQSHLLLLPLPSWQGGSTPTLRQPLPQGSDPDRDFDVFPCSIVQKPAVLTQSWLGCLAARSALTRHGGLHRYLPPVELKAT